METPVEPVWSIRKVGAGSETKWEGKKSLFVWVKWVKEMKGGRGEGNMAACADTLTVEESLQDLSLSVREFLSSTQTPEQHWTCETLSVAMRHNES